MLRTYLVIEVNDEGFSEEYVLQGESFEDAITKELQENKQTMMFDFEEKDMSIEEMVTVVFDLISNSYVDNDSAYQSIVYDVTEMPVRLYPKTQEELT